MSRYEKVHQNPQGFGDARPTAIQIIKDEGVEGKLEGKVIVITGTSAGIGVETARALKLTGARLLCTARDLKKAATALEGILEPGKVELVELDNASLKSVRKGAAEILARTNNQVNILINNAGIMAPQELTLTEDGFEIQFGVNHLAHFLLFELLKPALLASSTPSLKSRVVTLSSSAHNVQGINDSDNYNYEKGGYTPFGAYGQSKTANVYFSNEIERRYGSQGLHATAVHPGMVATSLTRHVGDEMSEAMKANPGLANLLKNPEQGAATTVWAAIGKEWENRGGAFLADVAEQSRSDGGHELLTVGYAEWIEDTEKQARLWKDSLRLVGLSN